MTTVIKIKKTIEEDKEVTLPYYAEYGTSLYKVESEKRVIAISKEGKKQGIEIHNDGKWLVDVVLTDRTPQLITAEEFKVAYQKALSHINHEAFMQQSQAATAKEIEESSYEEAATEIFDRNEDLSHAVNELSNHY